MAEKRERRRRVGDNPSDERSNSGNNNLQLVLEERVDKSSAKKRDQRTVNKSDEFGREEEQSRSGMTFDHMLRTSIDLDEVAKRYIERIINIGSRRLAKDLLDLLEATSKAIEQNANLLRILRQHLGNSTNEEVF